MTQLNYREIQKALRIEKYKNIANYDKVVDLGINAMWEDLCEKVHGQNIDPTELFDVELENLKDLEYSMKLMNICYLSELWEQDLYSFLKEEGLIEVSSNEYRATKRILEQNFPTCAISNFPKIVEMRTLVNAIKHGEGNAFTAIRQATNETILADSNIGIADESGTVTKKKQVEIDGNNALTGRTLNVDGKLQEYSSAVVDFWKCVYSAQPSPTESPEQ